MRLFADAPPSVGTCPRWHISSNIGRVMGTATRRVVIVGGEFGGIRCAKTLRRRLGTEDCEIVLFNRENHMVFHPLLPEVAGASINPDAWRRRCARC
jgi:hypothetical protein